VTELAVAPITDADVDALIALWQRCGLTRPWNDPSGDIAFARRTPTAEILIGRHDGAIVAATMVGHDGHRGWIYYLGVDPEQRRKDFGRAIMAAAEDWLRRQGVEKVMLMVRADNKQVQAFYDSIGYGVQERVVYAKWLDGRPMTP
jgi:ribosomal protein S18 acetylase RimI-like enzyme